MRKCEKCGKEFEYSYLLIKHQTRKRNCATIENINKNYDIKLKIINNIISSKTEESLNIKTKCLFCEKVFFNRANTSRHILHNCIEKQKLIDDKTKIEEEKNKLLQDNHNQQQLQQKNDEIKELRETVAKLIKNTSNNIIINNNGTINNNNLIVNINSFGKENLSHISEKDYKKYISTYFKGFINFI